ncbi:MAG: hypothetical protein QGG36_08720, partial [Pirellulaceae bacterium]|nr:hypothetical protein [Pirellulaceae bacterium]
MSNEHTNLLRRPAAIDGLIVALLLATAGLAISHHNTDPDFWGHVAYGKDVLRSGIPAETTYSYNAPGYRWINHENLAEITYASIMKHFGAPALLALKCALGVFVFAWSYAAARSAGVRQLAAIAGMLLAAANLMHFWTIRPQLFTYFFFAVMIGALTWCFRGWEGRWALPWRRDGVWSSEADFNNSRRRWLWAAPVLFCLWANSHGGFAAGLVIFTAYLGLRSCEAIVCLRWRAAPVVAQFAAVVAICAAVTLLNPYGWELHRWMLGSLGSPRPEILEWRSPEFTYVWAPYWTLVIVGTLAIACCRRPRDITQLLLLAAVLSQSFAHRRHIAFLAIMCAFWLPPYLQSFLARLRIGLDEETFGQSLSQRLRPLFAVVLLCGIGLIGLSLTRQLNTITVKRDAYPVSAFQFMSDQKLSGKLVVRFMWAQYAISAFGSEQPGDGVQVAFDGRFRTCYPQDIVDMYFDFAVGMGQGEPRFREADFAPDPA